MTYVLHRVFCSTPGDLEPERQAFHEAIGQVNEAEGVSKGHLFVPVSIVPNMVNKLTFQPIVEANVQACEFFVQVLQNTWGPPERNFEYEYNLACGPKADPGSLMEGVAVFFKKADGLQVDPEILQLKASMQMQEAPTAYEFASLDEFKQILRAQLSAWAKIVCRLSSRGAQFAE